MYRFPAAARPRFGVCRYMPTPLEGDPIIPSGANTRILGRTHPPITAITKRKSASVRTLTSADDVAAAEQSNSIFSCSGPPFPQ